MGIFSFERGGWGWSPIPKSICQNSYQKVNIFVKTKNAPNDLKCKINHIFFWKQGFPKGGEGGGPTLGKNSQKILFFFVGSVPNLPCLIFDDSSGVTKGGWQAKAGEGHLK